MPAVTCLCGHRIDVSGIPSENVYLGFSDAWFNTISERLERVPDSSVDHALEVMAFDLIGSRGRRSFRIYPCRQCGRLTIDSGEFRLRFSPEEGDVTSWIRDMDLDMASFRGLMEE
jgi:hypothetical protein